jgi:hypothetical protein
MIVSDLNTTAADLAQAHQEPELVIGNKLYRGRLLSIEEWLPFFEERFALEQAAAKAAEAGAVVDMRPWVKHWVAYLRTVFPRSRFRWWVPDPVQAIRELPGMALRDEYERFFLHQARVLGMKDGASQTSGISSSQPTPGTVPHQSG